MLWRPTKKQPGLKGNVGLQEEPPNQTKKQTHKHTRMRRRGDRSKHRGRWCGRCGNCSMAPMTKAACKTKGKKGANKRELKAIILDIDLY